MDDICYDISVPIKWFADDRILYNKIKTAQDQINQNDNLLKKHWCDKWKMVLNPRKSIFISMTRKKQFLSFNYSTGDTKLVLVDKNK